MKLTDDVLMTSVKTICAAYVNEPVDKFSIFMDVIDMEDADEFVRFPLSYNYKTLYLGKYYTRDEWESMVGFLAAALLFSDDIARDKDMGKLEKELLGMMHKHVLEARNLVLTSKIALDTEAVLESAISSLIETFMEWIRSILNE